MVVKVYCIDMDPKDDIVSQTAVEIPTPNYLLTNPEDINVSEFFADIGKIEAETGISPMEMCTEIRTSAKKIKMGSTEEGNLKGSHEYLLQYDIDMEDPSYAYDINILRTLKNIPSIFRLIENRSNNLSSSSINEIFRNDIQRIVIKPSEAYLRDKYFDNGKLVTLDYIKKDTDAPANIQRHVTTREVGEIILPQTYLLYSRIAENLKNKKTVIQSQP